MQNVAEVHKRSPLIFSSQFWDVHKEASGHTGLLFCLGRSRLFCKQHEWRKIDIAALARSRCKRTNYRKTSHSISSRCIPSLQLSCLGRLTVAVVVAIVATAAPHVLLSLVAWVIVIVVGGGVVGVAAGMCWLRFCCCQLTGIFLSLLKSAKC